MKIDKNTANAYVTKNILLEYQNIKISLEKITLQIGLKKFCD